MTTQKTKSKWRKKADQLTEEMEAYAEEHDCWCGEFYCSHMLKARAQKFKKRIDEELSCMLNK